MASETVHLMRCLRQVHKALAEANGILAGISQPCVCREVLLSGPGTAYILGLSEVYRVSKRLERGMKARKLASELLEHTLRQVDLAWNNLLSFLTFGHSLFQALDFQIVEPFVGSDPLLVAPSLLAPSSLCGVCLTEVKQEPQAPSGNATPVSYQGSSFHASCANFWLNCVDATLPREAESLFSSEFLNAPRPSILPEGKRDTPPGLLGPSRSC